MRPLLALSALVLALAGCAGGPEANRAHELLLQADAATAKLTSARYSATTSFAVAGQSFSFEIDGAVVLGGKNQGDQWARMKSGDIPGAGPVTMTIVRRGDRMILAGMGRQQEVPVPKELVAQQAAWGALGATKLATCVQKVAVREGENLNGEPATVVAGVIDTGCALDQMASFSSLGQSSALDLDWGSLGVDLGVARATLYFSDRTQLLVGGVIALTMKVQGQEMSFKLVYRLTNVNEPVRFPL